VSSSHYADEQRRPVLSSIYSIKTSLETRHDEPNSTEDELASKCQDKIETQLESIPDSSTYDFYA